MGTNFDMGSHQPTIKLEIGWPMEAMTVAILRVQDKIFVTLILCMIHFIMILSAIVDKKLNCLGLEVKPFFTNQVAVITVKI